jgi:hypothetical protein
MSELLKVDDASAFDPNNIIQVGDSRFVVIELVDGKTIRVQEFPWIDAKS